MCLVGDDECAVDAGLVGVLGKAARGLYCIEEPVPFRGQGLETRTHYLAGDVHDDFRRVVGEGRTISREPVSRQASGANRRAKIKGMRKRRSWALSNGKCRANIDLRTESCQMSATQLR